jgi:pimeloyl-ACP methyl ester carboxylesterase/quercetin dioxygenase-like cupin family protein
MPRRRTDRVFTTAEQAPVALPNSPRTSHAGTRRAACCSLAVTLLTLFSAGRVMQASPNAESLRVSVETPTATIGGTLLLPRSNRPYPCVVIAGGTLSQLRDGELVSRPGVPERKALQRLAESLAGAGYGSFRYDQVGFGESRAKAGYRDLYDGDAEVLAEIYRYVRSRSECKSVIAAGESAGAYVVSLAARRGAHADANLLLGGFCGKAEEIFSYNFGRMGAYVARSEANAKWAREKNLSRELAYGRQWKAMFAAARAGKESFEVADGDFRQVAQLARRAEELNFPPDRMYEYLRGPALALAGTKDLNVAPHHAACAVAAIHRAGNFQARVEMIPDADHNFQIAAAEPDGAFRERYTFASFLRPYHPQLDHEIFEWLEELDGKHSHGHAHEEVSSPRDSTFYSRAIHAPEVESKTDVSPERIHLAPGVTIIDNILDASKAVGVDTLEGVIGPLLRTPEMRAHYIDMPAGLFLDEHPHAKGSIIYTVRGEWGLESQGRWHHMKPGSLYWFGDSVPTGFQVPFRENAYILIFKAVPGNDDGEFMKYLRGLAANLRKDQDGGMVFHLTGLPAGHPARAFARTVNPKFDQEFPTTEKNAN